ncbi:MAG: Cof-type HAD-IIB family hydrolase [Acidaminococcus sp.]|jgi:Cof subfamily protein (haloacid dehalogenase superfamily)|nr:Cof-type HAD-IIB family hydrolase [Acidaminococcus sp.]
MPIKMIAMDLDGTLLDSEKNIAPADLEAVKKAVAAGYEVTLATGRMFRSALPYAKELTIKNPLIVYNGAWIKDPVTGDELGEWSVPVDAAQAVIDECMERGFYIQAYIDDTLWVYQDCEEARFYSHFSRVPYEIKGELMHHLPKGPHKLLVIAKETGELRKILETKFAGRVKIMSSSSGFLEITAPEASKWKAVQCLAAKKGIRAEEIMCVGDSENDLEMIQNCGFGVAMGNAKDFVLKAARVVTAPNSRQGISVILNSILTQQIEVPEE